MIDYAKVLKQFQTPCYVYDIDALLKRVTYLKKMLGSEYDLVYAVKANTFIAKHLENVVARYEICSPGEYEICNNLKIDPQKMVISGVYKDEETMVTMLKNNPHILKYTIESMGQYELLRTLTEKYKQPIHILPRLTSGNQFGITEEELFTLIKENNSPYITIDGIEYFSGTQKHSLKRVEKEIAYLDSLVTKLKEELNFEVLEIEYGTGLPVFYYQDEEFAEAEFLTNFKQILAKLKPKVTLEIGRSIAASCGYYLTKVVDLKSNKYGNFVICDGGINHLVYYGQTMGMKIPHYDLWPQKEDNKETYNLCGSLCTINDFLVKNITTRKLTIGDTFIFKNVGAYSSTEGIALFLSRDLPQVILKYNEQYKLVRDKEKTSKLNFPKDIEKE